MKKILTTGLIAFALAAACINVQAKPLDKIVAVVNDGVVLESELDAAIAQIRNQAGARIDQMPRDQLRSRILDQLVVTKLQVERAKQRGLSVSDDEIQKGMDRIAKQNGLNRAQFMQAVAHDGVDPHSLREQVRDDLLVSKLRRDAVMKQVVVTPDDIDRYLENKSLRADESGTPASKRVMVQEVKLRHIRLTPNEIRGDQRTRDLARQLRQRVEAGDDFAALARQNSDDSATANQGGELGWVQPTQYSPSTQSQLADMQPGQVSRVFQTDKGYELLKLEDRRQQDKTLEAARQKARQTLGEQKAQEEGALWLRKLRDEAYVDIRMPGYQPQAEK